MALSAEEKKRLQAFEKGYSGPTGSVKQSVSTGAGRQSASRTKTIGKSTVRGEKPNTGTSARRTGSGVSLGAAAVSSTAAGAAGPFLSQRKNTAVQSNSAAQKSRKQEEAAINLAFVHRSYEREKEDIQAQIADQFKKLGMANSFSEIDDIQDEIDRLEADKKESDRKLSRLQEIEKERAEKLRTQKAQLSKMMNSTSSVELAEEYRQRIQDLDEEIDTLDPTILSRAGNWLGAVTKSIGGSALNTADMFFGQGYSGRDMVLDEIAAIDRQIDAYKKQLPAASPEEREKLEALISGQETLRTHWEMQLTDELDKADEQTKARSEKLRTAADKLTEASIQDRSQVTQNLGPVGKFLAEGSVMIGEMAADLAAGAASGTGMLPMALRVFGSSSQQARWEGAGREEQFVYGTLSAVTALATEKIANVAKPLASTFGRGVTDRAVSKAVQNAIARLSVTQQGRRALGKAANILLSAGGEGFEEGLEAVLDPLYQRLTYNPDAEWNLEDIAYQALQGAFGGGVFGLSGNVMDIRTGKVHGPEGTVDSARANFYNEANGGIENGGNDQLHRTAGAGVRTGRNGSETDTNQQRERPFRRGDLSFPGVVLLSPESQDTLARRGAADSARTSFYKEANGGIADGGNDQLYRTAGAGVRTGRNGSETDSRLQGRPENVGRGDLSFPGVVLLSPESQDTPARRGAYVELYESSGDSAAFSAALDAARAADAENGWAVSPQTAQELKENGVRTFLDANGTTGFGITRDGDIVAVFANKAAGAPKGATKSTLPQAVASGGVKLDCYGDALLNLYSNYGFIPVARVKFSPEYANPGWTPEKGTPDIYFMMHNGDSADTVVQNFARYKQWTKAELDALPEMDYDEAYAYRDGLLAERAGGAANPLIQAALEMQGAPGGFENGAGAENGLKDLEAEAHNVYHAAETVQSSFNTMLTEIADELGIHAVTAGQKSVRSMVDKVNRKREAGQNYGLLDMKDHTRGALVLDSFEQIPAVLKLLEEKNIPYQTEAVGPSEWGYNGFHITWRNANGISSEIQLTRPDVWQVKKESDAIYEKWRNVTNVDSLSPERQIEYFQDILRSNEMWRQLGLPDFSIYAANSSSDNLRALNISSEETGLDARDHAPLMNSSMPLPSRIGEISKMRPDSVIQATKSTPFLTESIIAKERNTVNNNTAMQNGERAGGLGNGAANGAESAGRIKEIQAATGYGEYGAKAFAAALESDAESRGPAVLRKEFRPAYEAGLAGVPAERAALLTGLQQEAFTAGRRDRIMQTGQDAERSTDSGRRQEDAGDDRRERKEKTARSGRVPGMVLRSETGSQEADAGIPGSHVQENGGGAGGNEAAPAEWARGGITEAGQGNGAERARTIAERAGAPVYVVKDAVLNAHSPGAHALTSDGIIYISDAVPLEYAAAVGYHELVHWRKQTGDRAYIQFLEDTYRKLNHSESANNLLALIANTRLKKDFMNLNTGGLQTVYDELNAIVYGFYKADADNARVKFAGAFQDYDGYIRELQRIMEGAPDGKTNDGVGAMTSDPASFSYLQNQSGVFHPEGENAARTAEVPVRDLEGRRISKTAQTALEAEVTTDEMADVIERDIASGRYSFNTVTDEEALAKAKSTIADRGFTSAYAGWHADVLSGKASKELSAMGQVLYSNAVNAGDVKLAADILTDFAAMTKTSAQTLQAARILKRLSPENRLYVLRRSAQNIAESVKKRTGKEVDIKINEELASEYSEAQTAEEREAIEQEILQDIANQTPATLGDKVNAWRYTSMLFNPKTHIRNIAGNAAFVPVRMAKNVLGAGLEAAYRAAGGKGERTKTVLNPVSAGDWALIQAAWSDYSTVSEEIMRAGKYDNPATQVDDMRTIFKFKPLEMVRKANSRALEFEDVLFSRAAYAESLAGYLKANGVTADEFLHAVREMETAAEKNTASNGGAESAVANYVDRAISKSRFVQNPVIAKETADDLKLGRVSDRLARTIREDYDVDISGYTHILTDNDIRHIYNRHGPHTNEAYPVTAEDIKSIPQIIENADNVYLVKRQDGKSGIYYEYRHNGTTYYLEQIIDSNKTLQNKQMIKVRTGEIPDIRGLREAVQKKRNAGSPPDAAVYTGPRMYVQDVRNSVSDASVPQKGRGVKNEGSTQAVRNASNGAVSTAVNADPAEHTPADQAVIEEYKRSADDKLKSFIIKVRGLYNQNYKNKIKQNIDVNTTRAAEKASELTGVDTTGFKHIINGSSVQHIDNRHGENGTADHSMANIEDFSRIGFVLDHFTKAEKLTANDMDTETLKLSRAWRDGDNAPSPVVRYSMPVNGTYYVVEAVPASNARALAVVSAYKTKGNNKRSTRNQELSLPENQTSSATSETNLEILGASIDASVPQKGRGVKNEGSTQAARNASNGAESTAADAGPAEHTPADQAVIEEYRNAVDENLVRFVEDSIANKGMNKGRYTLKPVSRRAAQDIKAITGIDAAGFKTVMEQRIAEHIVDRHGASGKADTTMRDIHDIARIQYVLSNYDHMEYAGKTNSYTTIKENGKPGLANAVRYIKAVDGTYYVVEAVPNTKSKTTYIVSAYMNNNKAGTQYPANAKSPSETSENANTAIPALSDASVPQKGRGVKNEGSTQAARNASNGAEINSLVDRARAYAIKEAQKASYRDYNAFSNWVAGWGSMGEGKGALRKGVSLAVEGALPFKRTPANLLVRGMEYSPAGLAKGIYDAAVKVRNGDLTAAEAIDEIASGITGTLLLSGAGALMRHLNLLTGGGSDDEEKDKFLTALGQQEYALSIGDRTYSIDWLSPDSLPLFLGAKMYDMAAGRETKKKRSPGDILTETLSVLGQITEPMLELSMLSSVSDLMNSVSYADNKMLYLLSNMAVSYASQFVPTLGGQVERTFFEDDRQTTYVDRASSIDSDWQYAIGQMFNKVPGVEYNQIPYTDVWGRTQDTGDLLYRMIMNFVNPAYVSEDRSTEVDYELVRLYDEGYTTILPEKPKQNTKVDDQYLTADEYSAYSSVKGQTSLDVITALFDSPLYGKMSDEERAETIADIYGYAGTRAKNEIRAERGDKEEKTKATEAMDSGLDAATYFALKNSALSGLEENADKFEVLAKENLSDSDLALFSAAFGLDTIYDSYSQYAKPADIAAEDYIEAWQFFDDAHSDYDASGKEIVRKKDKVMGNIDDFVLTPAQKDALYYAFGYKESTIDEAPWR